jgi:hypothetical protein
MHKLNLTLSFLYTLIALAEAIKMAINRALGHMGVKTLKNFSTVL